MKSLTHFETTPPPCCDPQAANAWLQCVAELALAGDRDAQLVLPNVAQHFLDSLRQAGVPR